MMKENIFAVIMAGGTGTRLWPMSRKERPKQFIDFFGYGSMLQKTVWRINNVVHPKNILVITNDLGKSITKEQLPEIPEENVIVEPIPKNTAPCIALATAVIKKRNENALVVTLPSDHLIGDISIFKQTIRAAFEVSSLSESLVTIGIKPSSPKTGYGYIQKSSSNERDIEKEIFSRFGIKCHQVKTFAEKPDLDMAKKFLAAGDFFWNSGIFVWSIDAIWKAFKQYAPSLYGDMETIYHSINTSQDREVIEKVYTWVKSTSIDVAVMEKASSVYMTEGLFKWSDTGSWDDLAKLKSIEDGQTKHNDLILEDSNNVTLLNTRNKNKIAVIGLDNIIIVQTDNAILVCKEGESQKVRSIVSHLKENNLDEFL